MSKRVSRTTRDGIHVADFQPVEKATTDAETETKEATTDDAQDLSPRAARRWQRIKEYFASPIKASAASTKGERHTSALRDHAFDKTPSDYRSQVAKFRGKRGDK